MMKKKAIAAKKVVVAMSGGVDSSVAAALLKEKGYDVIGITMNLLSNSTLEDGCCSLSAVEDARKVANKLGIPHYVVNFKDIFRKKVINDFIEQYNKGMTPNPCVRCNGSIKFDALLRKARELGADLLATGHYARVKRSGSRYLLLKGKDPKKDQSYFLYPLGQKALSRTIFPLGDLTKDKVRLLARKYGLKVADKPESQEICFINGDMKEHFDTKQGKIFDIKGRTIGTHKGYQLYTIGQRRGLGIASPEPLYVVSIDPKNNRLVVGNKGDAYGDDLIATHLNLITLDKLKSTMGVKARIRYKNPETPAKIMPLGSKKIKVMFKVPQFAIAPGQSVVFYKGDVVVGGGIIETQSVKSKAQKWE